MVPRSYGSITLYSNHERRVPHHGSRIPFLVLSSRVEGSSGRVGSRSRNLPWTSGYDSKRDGNPFILLKVRNSIPFYSTGSRPSLPVRPPPRDSCVHERKVLKVSRRKSIGLEMKGAGNRVRPLYEVPTARIPSDSPHSRRPRLPHLSVVPTRVLKRSVRASS